MRTISAKTILSGYADSGWFGASYNMNLYKGCCHGCIYCDSRSACYRVENFDEVRAKRDALSILERELRSRRRAGIVHTGAMSDPYNPFEEGERLTQGALRLLDRYGFGVVLATKSPLVVRDADLLACIRSHSPAAVNVTITTADDGLSRRIERHVPPASARLDAIRRLSEAGIPCGVLLMPVLPFLTDAPENVEAVVRQAARAGARWVFPGYCFGVTLRQNQREYFYERLDEEFPGLRERYSRTFGDRYVCRSPQARALGTIFRRACREEGLVYRMEDITARIREGYEAEQLRLF